MTPAIAECTGRIWGRQPPVCVKNKTKQKDTIHGWLQVSAVAGWWRGQRGMFDCLFNYLFSLPASAVPGGSYGTVKVVHQALPPAAICSAMVPWIPSHLVCPGWCSPPSVQPSIFFLSVYLLFGCGSGSGLSLSVFLAYPLWISRVSILGMYFLPILNTNFALHKSDHPVAIP